ncbi:6294_t:CDS:1, partial [Gigaspora margarita]
NTIRGNVNGTGGTCGTFWCTIKGNLETEEIDEVQKKLQSLENDMKEKIKSVLKAGQQELSIPKVFKQKECNLEELNLEKLIQLLPEREYIQLHFFTLHCSHLIMLKDDLELSKSRQKKPREDDLLKILKFPEFLDLNRLEQEL